MADTLLIHFNPDQPDNVTWSLVNNAGELSTMLSHGTLSDAAAIAEKHKTIVLLNSTAVHLDSVSLPINNQQKLLRAIPFALEEKLADDIDELHFIAGNKSSNGQTPVATIRHDTLNSILNALQASGIHPVAVISDMLCLTANSEQWAVLLQDENSKVQFDSTSAGEFDRDILPLLLKTELEQAEQNRPKKIILFSEESDDAEISSIEAIIPDDIELIKVAYNKHPLVIFCGQYKQALSLNLLQGKYKPQQKTNVNWQRWRLAASLSAIWLCLHLGITGVQYQNYQQSNDKLQVDIEKIYKKTFPESKRIVNAKKQMEQKLNALKGLGNTGSNSSMIALLADSSTAIAADKAITIQSINYRNNKIDIEVTGSNLQSIEQLNENLNQKTLASEIISSSSEKDQVKGNIRIKRANQS